MGSAVSAVTGSIGGLVGGAVGSIAEGMTPKIQTADQQRLNDQIAALRAQSGTYVQNQGTLQDQANSTLGNVYNNLNTANGLLGQAVTANNQVGGDALTILRNAATGGAPSAAQAQLQSGKDQAIATQQAMANSGNLSQMIGGQKTAMDNAANLTQQAANESAQLRANEMGTARGQYGQQAAAYANQATQNAAQSGALANTAAGVYGTQLGAAQGYGNLAQGSAANAGSLAQGGVGLSQGVQTQNAQNQVQAAGGLMNGAGAAVGMLASDENLKTNIQSDQNSRARGISDFFKNENKKPEPQEESTDDNGPKKFGGYSDDDPRKKAANDITKGFLSSDKEGKENIKGGSMLHAFLDKLNPVTFEYKEATGDMGRTPGTHLGVLAQDVEKAPGGDSMVKETPEGKAIDLASAVGMLMSAAADAHDRVSSLEELFKSKKGSKK